MKFTLINKRHLDIIRNWLPELGNFYDGHENSKFFDQITNKEICDPFGYFTKRKEIWTAVKNDELLGFVCLNFKRGGSVKIGPIMTNPNRRNEGVGKFLISKSIKLARAKKVRKLYATTPSQNIPASNLFKYSGFTKEASLPNQYRHGSEEYVWGFFLDEPVNIFKVTNSLLSKQFVSGNNKVRDYNDEEDRHFLESTINLISEWHDNIDSNFIEGIVNATKRDLDYETKGKKIFISQVGHEYSGIAVTAPKRGGPVKVYPIFGSDKAQKKLVEHIKDFYSKKQFKKLYTLTPASDTNHLQLLLELGFLSRGMLRSPYKDGYDLSILDIQI